MVREVHFSPRVSSTWGRLPLLPNIVLSTVSIGGGNLGVGYDLSWKVGRGLDLGVPSDCGLTLQ